MRGCRLVQIEVFPVDYNPKAGKLKLYSNIELKINLTGSDLVKTENKSRRYQSPAFEKLLKSAVINYGNYRQNGLNKSTLGGELSIGFLIITHDNFYNKIQPFVSWMAHKKFKITVTKLSELSDQSNTGIRNYIRDAYSTWSPPPSYVLLVGDTVYIPTFIGTGSGKVSDLYYSHIDTLDYLPDIWVSRFSVIDTNQTEIITEKSINYETLNLSSGTSWIKKAAFLAGNDHYYVSEGTHNYVISTYMDPNDYISDKLYEETYGATTEDVSSALNEGRSIVTYSGHGMETYWSDGPSFTQSDVKSLTNLDKYPFIFSFTCYTGNFGYSECFGETWLQEEGKGSVTFGGGFWRYILG